MQKKLVFWLLIGLLLYSCVKTDDYDVPEMDIPDINIEGEFHFHYSSKRKF